MTRTSTRRACSLAVISGGPSGGLYRTALASRLTRTRSSSAGSAWTSGRSSGTRDA